mmetsp:Transcript_5398/g.15672  ORF Transcript_5398/g.15672 Transcript_5398/m.15672 type:complete len:378 (-) Transcript_5398:90-1223(-)|eukprot:CAMPEP_0172363722 /NCGR_PEP_ID=MMETSP1060-20121228/7001_1 /TAXON_ID=37318 /ORGANISM="Pseudo-nitzschia pungens, Strain cf. cingulata" /LENGTH=377 /DNA_ID=CAMNT_0013086531 /DNA_START=75 /DNA_END=1208 /DNA_ORIENTATION=+
MTYPYILGTNRGRKKKSYINNEAEGAMSSERRDMIKRKLYANHMMDDNRDRDHDKHDNDGFDYLASLRLSSTSSSHARHNQKPQKSSRPKPVSRIRSLESSVVITGSSCRMDRGRSLAPALSTNAKGRCYDHLNEQHPLRARQIGRRRTMDLAETPASSEETEKPKRRFSLSPGRLCRKNNPNRASRKAATAGRELETETESEASSPPSSPRSPSQRSRSHSPHSLRQHVEKTKAATRGDSNPTMPRPRLLRRNSLSRCNNNTNNNTNEHLSLDSSQHSAVSMGERSREDIYNSALRRAQERKAMKLHPRGVHKRKAAVPQTAPQTTALSLGAQLSSLNNHSDEESDDDDDDDDDTENKSIFSSILRAVENIYDECS